MNAQYDFPSPYWDSISDGAKDLINKLLVLDVDRRLSAKEILEHPWLNTQNTRDQLPFVADNYNKMTKAVKIVNIFFNFLIFFIFIFSVMLRLPNLLLTSGVN